MKIGILAVQGDFSLHKTTLSNIGVEPVEVRHSYQLDNINGIIIPGGESTTFNIVLNASDLGDTLRYRLREGLPVLGTCAGSIILGRGTGLPQPRFNLIDMEVIRNGYGRQVDSFVTPVDITGFDSEFMGVFIRAPRFAKPSTAVEVLATLNGDPVMARQGNLLVTAFHPELTDDERVHRYFIQQFCSEVSI